MHMMLKIKTAQAPPKKHSIFTNWNDVMALKIQICS